MYNLTSVILISYETKTQNLQKKKKQCEKNILVGHHCAFWIVTSNLFYIPNLLCSKIKMYSVSNLNMTVTKEDNIADNQNVHVNEDDHRGEEARGTQRHVKLHQYQ